MRFIAYAVALVTLAGCASHPPVPVVDSRPPVAVESGRGANSAQGSGVRDARAGYYAVKKGDTVYRVAQINKVSVADLMTWNNLTDASKVDVGQELRVTPPPGAVEVKPIAAQAPIVVVGDNGTAPAAVPTSVAPTAGVAPAGGAAAQVRQPKGGKVPYSDAALGEVRSLEGSVVPATPVETPGTTAVSPMASGVDWTWPSAGKVIRGFGKNGSGEISRGIDISGRRGESIQAAASGQVKYVGALKDYGDFVVVHHTGDYLSVYAHTDKILVKTDQVVAKGQKIAEVGSSGTDQPKLHFEIRYKGEPVDPLKFLPERQ